MPCHARTLALSTRYRCPPLTPIIRHNLKIIAAVALTLLLVGCSAAASIDPVATVPGAPTSPVATSGNTSATIAFTAPASNGGSSVTGFMATCIAGADTKTGSNPISPVLVIGLTNGISYNCSVRAINAVGIGSPSPTVSVTPAPRSSPN